MNSSKENKFQKLCEQTEYNVVTITTETEKKTSDRRTDMMEVDGFSVYFVQKSKKGVSI